MNTTSIVARNALGDIIDTDTPYLFICDDPYGCYTAYGYVQSVYQQADDNQINARVAIIATKRPIDDQLLPARAPFAIKHVAACKLFPAPSSIELVPSIDWNQPLWSVGVGDAVIDVATVDTNVKLVTFDRMPYKWPYNDDGTPSSNFSWLPALTNADPQAHLPKTIARDDAYKVISYVDNEILYEFTNLTKAEAVYILAVSEAYANMSSFGAKQLCSKLAAVQAVLKKRYGENATQRFCPPDIDDVAQLRARFGDADQVDVGAARVEVQYSPTSSFSVDVDFYGELDGEINAIIGNNTVV